MGTVFPASRSHDGFRSRKTKGSLADTFQCKIWRRSQTPGRLIHSLRGGGEHYCGYTALWKQIGTPDASAEDSDYVKGHVLALWPSEEAPDRLSLGAVELHANLRQTNFTTECAIHCHHPAKLLVPKLWLRYPKVGHMGTYMSSDTDIEVNAMFNVE